MFSFIQYQAITTIVSVLFGLHSSLTAVAALVTGRKGFQLQVYSDGFLAETAVATLFGEGATAIGPLGSLILEKAAVIMGPQKEAAMFTLPGSPGALKLVRATGGATEIVLATDKSLRVGTAGGKLSPEQVLWQYSHQILPGASGLQREFVVPVLKATKKTVPLVMCPSKKSGYGDVYIQSRAQSSGGNCFPVRLLVVPA